MADSDRRAQQIAAVHDLLDSAGYLIRDADPICAELVDAVEAVRRIPADQVGAYAAGWAAAVEALHHDGRYETWRDQQQNHIPATFSARTARIHAAGYLEAVAPDGAPS
jgi:hypothetical protein